MIVDCQWKRSSPTGPALHVEGGSLERSISSLFMRFVAAMLLGVAAIRRLHSRGTGGGQCAGVRVWGQGVPVGAAWGKAFLCKPPRAAHHCPAWGPFAGHRA